jgi:PST family polysaccharide transporter
MLKHIFKGVASFSSSVLLVRLAALFSQFCLGWFLSKQDYGLYGIAVSLGAFAASFRVSGVFKILVQAEGDFDEISDGGFLVSLIFATLAFVVMVVSGIVYSRFANCPAVLPITCVLAVGLLLAFPVPVFQAGLSRDLRFGSVARVNAIVGVVQNLAVIPLAALGFGALSFVLPLPFIRLLETSIYKRMLPQARISGFWKRCNKAGVVRLLGPVRWIMLSALLISLVQRGDYFVLGFVVDSTLIGIYFFGYQLTTAFSTMLSGPLNKVFMPALRAKNDDPDSQQRIFGRSLKAMLAVLLPVFGGLAFVIGPFIHLVWGGKWDDAIVVSQILLLVLPFRLLAPLYRSLLEARGKWAMASAMLVVQAGGVLLSAVWGGLGGSVASIVVWIASWQVIYSLIGLVSIPWLLRFNMNSLFWFVGRLVMVFCGSMYLTARLCPAVAQNLDILGIFVPLFTFYALAALFSFAFLPRELMGSIKWAVAVVRKKLYAAL